MDDLLRKDQEIDIEIDVSTSVSAPPLDPLDGTESEITEELPLETTPNVTTGITDYTDVTPDAVSILDEEVLDNLLYETDPSGVTNILNSIVDEIFSEETNLRRIVADSLADHQEVTLQQIKMIKVPTALKKKGRP